MLCSDGLSGVVSEETLAEAMLDPDPQATADRLIELALRGGGPDNITVIVADVVEDGGYGTTTMEPVVDGAAGDNIGQRSVDPRSAAGRAALADPPQPPPTTTTAAVGSDAGASAAPAAHRRRLRLALSGVALLVVLAAIGVGVWIWALGHWFVGVQGSGDGEHVAVFRGLPASVIGVDLYRVDRSTDLAVGDLTPAARSRVTKGITANGSADASRIVAALRDQRLPVCGAAAADGTGAPAPGTAAPTPAGAPTTLSPPSSDAPVSSAAAPSSSAAGGRPGVDCREAK
jgi:protein phosphatase